MQTPQPICLSLIDEGKNILLDWHLASIFWIILASSLMVGQFKAECLSLWSTIFVSKGRRPPIECGIVRFSTWVGSGHTRKYCIRLKNTLAYFFLIHEWKKFYKIATRCSCKGNVVGTYCDQCRAQYYKTFCASNLWTFVISYRIFPLQAFPALSNHCGLGKVP